MPLFLYWIVMIENCLKENLSIYESMCSHGNIKLWVHKDVEEIQNIDVVDEIQNSICR